MYLHKNLIFWKNIKNIFTNKKRYDILSTELSFESIQNFSGDDYIEVIREELGPPLENSPEIPPSSREEGLRLLHGLATNLATSLQTPQEA